MRIFLALLVSAVSFGPASAQLSLPGATAPAPVGSVAAPVSVPKPRRTQPRAPVAAASPPETSLAGKTLYLDGGGSEIVFAARDKTVDVSRLLLKGTKISSPRDACQIQLQGMPMSLNDLGKVEGLSRFALPLTACPISFEVLDGAILVATDAPKCTFKDADCEVSPAGLWGPPPGDIGPDQVKTIEHERVRAESDVRQAYKSLVGSTKDRTLVRGFASDQAGFSSRREEICRDYIGEARHGFCATRLTQARAQTLATAAVAAEAAKPKHKAKP